MQRHSIVSSSLRKYTKNSKNVAKTYKFTKKQLKIGGKTSTSSQRFEELRITVPTLTWAVIITAILTALGNLFIFFLPFPFSCNMNAGTTVTAWGFDYICEIDGLRLFRERGSELSLVYSKIP